MLPQQPNSSSDVSCPTVVVNVPVEVVWVFLMEPAGWGSIFDRRIISINPCGSAVIGQGVEGETGPRLLHLKIAFQVTGIDADRHRLDVKLPFGVTVQEALCWTPIDAVSCRVEHRCDFGFPAGWRGALAQSLTRRERDADPLESLSHLKRAVERHHFDF